MASKSQSHEAFAARTGGSPATFGKIDRVLAADGYGQPGGRGGGKNTVHVEAPYLRNVLLGSAAYQPSDAAAVVRNALGCDYLGSALSLESITSGHATRTEPEQVNVPELGQGSTLASYIADRIEAFAAEPPDAPQTMQGHPLNIEKSLIRVDFDPFAAQVEWRAEGGLLLIHYFVLPSEVDARRHLAPEDAAKDLARIRRSSILPASLLFTAAQLLADGWVKRGRRLPFSGQGGATSSATPTDEKTPGLPGSGASTLTKLTTTKQPRGQHAAGTLLPNPETKRVCANYQAHSSRGPFPLSKEPRSYATRPQNL